MAHLVVVGTTATTTRGRRSTIRQPDGSPREAGPPLPILYLIVYKNDYQLGLREYASLFGRVPMVPRYALGGWYSRYWEYHDQELKDIVNEYRRRQIPLDVLVVDVDWHTNGWEGYDWNKEYFSRSHWLPEMVP